MKQFKNNNRGIHNNFINAACVCPLYVITIAQLLLKMHSSTRCLTFNGEAQCNTTRGDPKLLSTHIACVYSATSQPNTKMSVQGSSRPVDKSAE